MSAPNDSSDIHRLAELVAVRNDWERETAGIIWRPALISNLGEYIAARIFNIQLHEDAARRAADGVFADGPLSGQSVIIKWYARLENMLDLAPGYPDTFLVLAGPRVITGKPPDDHIRPWLIESVYLFKAERLLEQLNDVRLGVATSIRQTLWDAAELYPEPRSKDLTLTDAQRELLKLFGAGGSKVNGSR